MPVIKSFAHSKSVHKKITLQRKRLQTAFQREMTQTLRGIARDVSRDMQAGVTPNFEKYNSEIAGILRRNHRRVSASFESNIRKALNFTEDKAQIDNSIHTEFQRYQDRIIPETTRQILETTQEDFRAAQRSVSDTGASSDAAAASVAKTLRARAGWRGEMIAKTEVLKASSTTQDFEFKALNNNDNFRQKHSLEKVWSTEIDQATREWHADADGQKAQNGLFIVNGELLAYPGDTSNGASAGNIINCDCTVLYQE